MIRVLGNFFAKVARRWLPDAFLFALILSFIVFILGMVVEGQSFIAMTGYFGGGMWAFLAFSMQMALIIVTGSAMAQSKPVHKFLKSIAKLAKTPTPGYRSCFFCSCYLLLAELGFRSYYRCSSCKGTCKECTRSSLSAACCRCIQRVRCMACRSFRLYPPENCRS